MLVVGSAIPTIKTGGNIRNFFPSNHRVIQDSTSIEKEIGPLSSVELLLTFKQPDRHNDINRVRGIRLLCSRLMNETDIEATVSAATFAPLWRKRPSALRKAFELEKVAKLKKQLQDFKLLVSNSDNQTETWRVSLRYSGLKTVDVPQLIRKIESETDRVFYRDGKLVFEGESLTVQPTGEFVLFDHVDRQFMKDLTITYSTAVVLISIVVLLILRSGAGMLLASLPNIFPALIVLGTAGLLGQLLDVASLMTASVALGIAVDDTLHFVMWWRDKVQEGFSSEASIIDAMDHCGYAMIQTSIACGVSVFLYAFCGFLPTVRFGILLSSMMLMALVGDLILLPALLSTRFAKRVLANSVSPTDKSTP